VHLSPGTGETEAVALRADGLSKRFGPVRALEEVSLDARAGEILALMGENGAGKSTLLKILSGFYAPDRGRVLRDGHEADLTSPRAAHAAGIRVIYQEPEIIPHVSVAENVYVGALPSRGRLFDRRALIQRVRRDIDRLGFSGVLDAAMQGDRLSPAQRQLVEVLRALVFDAKVIAFDEPTSSLSDHEVDALFALLRRLRAHGVAVMYVSHRMKEIFEVADRVAVLRDGRLVSVRAVDETTEGELVRMMVGRDLGQMFARERHEPGQVMLSAHGVTTDDVSDVSLEVRAGEVVALAGLVGAGRTELARALVGDVPMQSGEVRVAGRPLRLRSPRDAVRAGIGLAPEERKAEALLLKRSVRDNVSLAILGRIQRARFVRRGEERRITREYVDRLQIRARSIEQEVSTLSGGNQQKTVLARWLARRPRVLILDEPTRGVDVGAKAEIYSIINDLAGEGVAVLVISSDLPEVLGLADRIVVMQDGRVTGELDREEATEERVLTLAIRDQLTTTTADPGDAS
jgi:L-arabinose transport system ATP-binding protein